MAQTAESKAQKAELKSFARKIAEDQQREIAQMKQWRGEWYSGRQQTMNMEMPVMMDSMKAMKKDAMKAMTGPDFDRMFLDMMIPHHEGAVAMAREALNKSEHSEVEKFAQQIIDAMHFEMVDKMVAGKANAPGNPCCADVQVNQCYRCHQTDSWNNIKGVGWYKHH